MDSVHSEIEFSEAELAEAGLLHDLDVPAEAEPRVIQEPVLVPECLPRRTSSQTTPHLSVPLDQATSLSAPYPAALESELIFSTERLCPVWRSSIAPAMHPAAAAGPADRPCHPPKWQEANKSTLPEKVPGAAKGDQTACLA